MQLIDLRIFMQPHNENHATLYVHRKVSHGVPLNLRTLLNAVWLGLCLYFKSGRQRFETCTQYVRNLIGSVYWTNVSALANAIKILPFDFLGWKVY